MESAGGSRFAQQHTAGNYPRKVAEDDDEDAFSLSPSRRKKETDDKHGGGHDDARWDAEEDCLIGGVAETFQDQTGEVGLQTVGHVVTEDGENEHPHLDVAKSFFDL